MKKIPAHQADPDQPKTIRSNGKVRRKPDQQEGWNGDQAAPPMREPKTLAKVLAT